MRKLTMAITQRVTIILLFIAAATWLAWPRDHRVGAQVYRPTPSPKPKPAPTPARRPVVKPAPTPRPRPTPTPESRPRILIPPAPTPTPKSASFSSPTLSTFSFETVTLDERGNEKPRRRLQADFFTEDLGGGVTMEMVRIPAGEFAMGSNDGEIQEAFADAKRYFSGASLDIYKRESPKHTVRVSEFYLGRFEVTRAQWKQVARMLKVKIELNEDPSNFKDSWKQPVEQVSWSEAVEFCERLQKRTGRAYRLPSEAEWEYAARAGTTTAFAFGPTITPQIVNYDGNYHYGNAPKGDYRQKTVAVGSLGVANAFGLFDMHGNVWEWCQDYWHDSYNGAPTDGSAWLSGGDSSLRVLRGGSWGYLGGACRAAARSRYGVGVRGIDVGLRVGVAART